MSTRPVIGITTYAQEASWGVWRLPAALIPLDYVDAVERAGGRPVLIPPSEVGVAETLDTLDGIVFSGGADVDPARYGADPHPETDTPQARRDAGEMALLEAALERDLPTLAICRGFQLLNVARGGDLVQHLPEMTGNDAHKQVPGEFAVHPVEVRAGSRLAGIVGSASDVTSHHHQALGRVGEGLVESAWAADGTLEAVEDPSLRFAVGVQWHPEAGEDAALFEALVEQAREYRAART
jgi:putative glutamine amidotransferase